ncbi:hypothetical protein NHX12_008611 [Muraenolepis orangiensis]|uniref:Uncharacterized protein n=1 Tax=Muraenolepis orangiensis TaxID=630683 RepID=A0A9Q0DLU9_9TELE|nr:hypothetical protein NHX12_008611 [Muraenolepis orangiensis]
MDKTGEGGNTEQNGRRSSGFTPRLLITELGGERGKRNNGELYSEMEATGTAPGLAVGAGLSTPSGVLEPPLALASWR